jgi:hypothetical protein
VGVQKLFSSGWLLATGAGLFGCTFERPTCGPEDGCSCAVPRMYSTVARSLADPVCAVVHLDPGIYLERLVVERSVTLMGSGAEASILDGEGAGTVIDIAAGLEVRLQSLAVRNGRARQGAGILNRGALRLEEVLVQDNTAEGEGPAGGGIWNAGELTLHASKISGNYVRSSAAMLMAGAGIASEGGTVRLEQNSEVARNEIISVGVASSSGRGAGISAMDAALVIADGSAVRGNVIDIDGHPMRATARGAGIYLEGKNGSASLVVRGAGSILGNSLVARGVDASAFGGGFYLETASLQLEDVALQDNQVVAIAEHVADAAGGGGTLQGATFEITGTSISGNTVTATGGSSSSTPAAS